MKTKKNIIVVGDKVLIDPDEKLDRTTATGLYLPPTVREKEKAHGGYVVKVGPGYPVHETGSGEEPWTLKNKSAPKFVPLQAAEGDYAIFLKDSAVEIEFEGKKYLIVPHSSMLALIKTELVNE